MLRMSTRGRGIGSKLSSDSAIRPKEPAALHSRPGGATSQPPRHPYENPGTSVRNRPEPAYGFARNPHLGHRIMSPAVRAEPVGAREKIHLENRLQHQLQG